MTRWRIPSGSPCRHTRWRTDSIRGEVIYIDSFGNCVSNIPARVLPPPGTPGVTVTCGGLAALPFVPTYGMVPEGAPLALVGSHGYLEIATRRGDAASEFGLGSGTPVHVSGIVQ